MISSLIAVIYQNYEYIIFFFYEITKLVEKIFERNIYPTFRYVQCTYIFICISIVVQYSHIMSYLTEQSIKNLMISYMYRLSSIVL